MSLKSSINRIFLEVDIIDEVGFLVTVGTNDSSILELTEDLHGFVPSVLLVQNFVYAFKTRFI